MDGTCRYADDTVKRDSPLQKHVQNTGRINTADTAAFQNQTCFHTAHRLLHISRILYTPGRPLASIPLHLTLILQKDILQKPS